MALVVWKTTTARISLSDKHFFYIYFKVSFINNKKKRIQDPATIPEPTAKARRWEIVFNPSNGEATSFLGHLFQQYSWWGSKLRNVIRCGGRPGWGDPDLCLPRGTDQAVRFHRTFPPAVVPKAFYNICPVSHRHTPVSIRVHLLKPLRLYQHHLVSYWELSPIPLYACAVNPFVTPWKGHLHHVNCIEEATDVQNE